MTSLSPLDAEKCHQEQTLCLQPRHQNIKSVNSNTHLSQISLVHTKLVKTLSSQTQTGQLHIFGLFFSFTLSWPFLTQVSRMQVYHFYIGWSHLHSALLLEPCGLSFPMSWVELKIWCRSWDQSHRNQIDLFKNLQLQQSFSVIVLN